MDLAFESSETTKQLAARARAYQRKPVELYTQEVQVESELPNALNIPPQSIEHYLEQAQSIEGRPAPLESASERQEQLTTLERALGTQLTELHTALSAAEAGSRPETVAAQLPAIGETIAITYKLAFDYIQAGTHEQDDTKSAFGEQLIQVAKGYTVYRDDLVRWVENGTSLPVLNLGNPILRAILPDAPTIETEDGLRIDPEALEAIRAAAPLFEALNAAINRVYESSNNYSYLSAQQIGIAARVLAERVPARETSSGKAENNILINPVGVWVEGDNPDQEVPWNEVDLVQGAEGCYASWNIRPKTPRPMGAHKNGKALKFKVTWFDLEGKPQEKLYAANAPIVKLFLHESDHFEGIHCVDRTPNAEIATSLPDYYTQKTPDNPEAARKATRAALQLGFMLQRVRDPNDPNLYYIPIGDQFCAVRVSDPHDQTEIGNEIDRILTELSVAERVDEAPYHTLSALIGATALSETKEIVHSIDGPEHGAFLTFKHVPFDPFMAEYHVPDPRQPPPMALFDYSVTGLTESTGLAGVQCMGLHYESGDGQAAATIVNARLHVLRRGRGSGTPFPVLTPIAQTTMADAIGQISMAKSKDYLAIGEAAIAHDRIQALNAHLQQLQFDEDGELILHRIPNNLNTSIVTRSEMTSIEPSDTGTYIISYTAWRKGETKSEERETAISGEFRRAGETLRLIALSTVFVRNENNPASKAVLDTPIDIILDRLMTLIASVQTSQEFNVALARENGQRAFIEFPFREETQPFTTQRADDGTINWTSNLTPQS